MRKVVKQALELSRLSRTPAVFQHESENSAPADRIVGNSRAMQLVYKQIGRIANENVNVLIEGQSGTGKELCARAIHQYGDRVKKSFVAINAAAIPEPLLESELFGHERGAFTGADRRRIGKFELANQGTLFLDEIGDMPLALQAKVLRVLQEGEFERVGGNETIRTDVRVVAATNHNLQKLIADGGFRQDLFYRLNGFTISLPPLHERLDDLPGLVDHYVSKFNTEMEREVRGLAPGMLEILGAHTWPGNIRELENSIRHAFINARGDILTEECFPESCRRDSQSDSQAPASLDIDQLVANYLATGHETIFRSVHDEVDRRMFKATGR